MPRLFKDKKTALNLARIGSFGGIIFTVTLLKDLYDNMGYRKVLETSDPLTSSVLNSGLLIICVFIGISLFSIWQIYRGNGRVSAITLSVLIGATIHINRTAGMSFFNSWPEWLSLLLVGLLALPASWAYKRLESQPNPEAFE